MTQEQIEQAAKEIINYNLVDLGDLTSERDLHRMLVEMANKVLSHQWISVEEALPTEYRNVFAMFENKHIINAYYDGESWWWNDGFPTGINTYGDAIYSSQCECEETPVKWMPIPKEGGEKW